MLGRRLRVADRALRNGVLARHRQRAAVDLAVGGQRHGIEEHERRWQHRFWQTPRQTRAQRSGIDAIGDDRIRHQPAVARAVLAQQHGHRLHTGQCRQRVVDFAQFNAKAAQLDLVIATADELQGVVGIPAREIAGTVHPRIGFMRKRIGQKAFRGELHGIEITAGDAGTADEQFADHAARHRLQMPVQQMDPHARQRPAGRQVLADDLRRIHGRQQRRADRGFGGAVVVAQHDATAGDAGETPHLFDRHAFAADHHQIQCRQQRLALRTRRPTLAPAAPQGGRRVDRGHPVVAAETLQLERTQFGRRRMQHQRRTAGQRRKHIAHGRVENQRRDHQQALAIEAMPRQETLHQIHRAAMLHHHALGRTGGTGGIDQISRIAGTHFDVRRSIRIHDRSGMQHRNCGHQRRRAFAQQRRYQQRGGAGILQQELQTFVGAGRIQRQIGRTGKQDAEHRDHRIRGTVAQHGDVCAGSDVLRMQGLRNAIGAAQRLQIRPFAAGLDQRGGVWRARSLKREQTVQGVGFRYERRPAIAQGGEDSPFLVVQQRDPRQRQVRICGDAAQQGHEVFRHTRDRRRCEQPGAVIDQPGQTFGAVGERNGQLKTRGIRIGLDVLGAQAVHAHVRSGRGRLEHEHRLEQWRPPRHALQVELFDHVFKRRLGVLQRIQHVRFRARQRLAERRVVAEIGAYCNGIDEQADDRFLFHRPAVGHRGADDDVAVAGPARQQRLKRAQHQHELGRAFTTGQLRHGIAQRVRESPHVPRALGRRDRGARPVRGQIQQAGRAGQRVLPVAQLPLAALFLGGQGLPQHHIAELQRLRRQFRLAPGAIGVVQRNQIVLQDAKRPHVRHKMVGRHQHHVRHGRKPHQPGPQQRRAGQIERTHRFFADASLQFAPASFFRNIHQIDHFHR